ncbi:MAG: flavodoxin-dependent (E)-4-hydroxy-3-methylbut-2-enyl-diphosphate synthase [Ruminococcaceae bacterium]|nr:flavodoxin-dependent (E)-4-hydroxy-3-methylbut-2-enyl-diphosphate synthase [Oscillospiraceae bacterium]
MNSDGVVMRRNSKSIRIGNTGIGGTYPITVQSMTNTRASDIEGTVGQILSLEEAGCEIIRMAVPKEENAVIFSAAKKAGSRIPLVADIHFDYRIALEAIKQGADKIRINPGNIGETWKIAEVAHACKDAGVPIRIGVNSGSLDKKLLDKYGSPTPEALAESALSQADILESFGFSDVVISIKSSTVQSMISACRLVAAQSEYPLHLGVTEAGDAYSGMVKNAIGIGTLLSEGIGDTIRVSLTADPAEEIRAAREILRALQLDHRGGVDIISCPTCGRTSIDLIGLQNRCRAALNKFDTHGKLLRVAIMGCVVNGPGEAREADYGIAGGDGSGLVFKKGEILRKVPENELVRALLDEIERDLREE